VPQLPFLLRWRFAVIGAWTAILAWIALRATPGAGGDWETFREGAQLLFHGHTTTFQHGAGLVTVHGGGLHLYAAHPAIQIGPLALTVAEVAGWFGGATRLITALLGLSLLLPAIGMVEAAARRRARASDLTLARITLVGGLLLAYSWVQASVQWRHLDDLLVCMSVAVTLWAIARERPWILGTAIGLGFAAKPTALLLVPLLLAPRGRSAKRRAVLAAAAIGAVAWLPFILAGGSLSAGVPQIPVEAGSGLAALGLRPSSMAPPLLRLLQLGCGLGFGTLLVLRRRYWAVPMVVFALRLALDPGIASYYPTIVLLGCLAADLAAGGRVWGGLRTAVAWAALVTPYALPGMHRWVELTSQQQQTCTLAGVSVLLASALVPSAESMRVGLRGLYRPAGRGSHALEPYRAAGVSTPQGP
jgi:hypothetical protein